MKTADLIKEFKKYKLGPYIEVPCSLLAPVINGLIEDRECDVLNPANEAVAMGLASGSFLATGRIPLVLTQNSGLCNTINALTSLNHIYKIPALYLISWRGLPGTEDAPQHSFMGAKLEKILKTFDIPYEVLSENSYRRQIKSLINRIKTTKRPGALLLKKGVIKDKARRAKIRRKSVEMSRAEALDVIMRASSGKAFYVTTNGYISREALSVLSAGGLEKKNPSFYMLGSMGHALPIGLGMARYIKKKKKVVVLDGDGGCLMHMGAMASVGRGISAAGNLIHVVLDNGVYASVGNQPTVSGDIDFGTIARGCGYAVIRHAKNSRSLRFAVSDLLRRKGPAFLHARISDRIEPPKARVSGRYACEEIKESFIKLIR